MSNASMTNIGFWSFGFGHSRLKRSGGQVFVIGILDFVIVLLVIDFLHFLSYF
jgi:hypothetical protein